MIRSALLVAVFTLIGCGSETAGTGSPGAGGAGGSGAPPGSAAAFVGTYAATFAATSTFSSPAGTPPASYTDTATITVTAKGSDSILMAWKVGNNPPSGTIEFKLDGASGQASGTGGTPWMGRLTNGAQQTSWCDVCSASVSGDKLTQSQQGHFEGVTANGIPYAGTYVGTWSGTRTN